jgi:ribokinase
VDAAKDAIGAANVFLAQLELPLDTVERGLEIARAAGVVTILNPAPACPLPNSMIELADFLIPNESEAALLTGLPVETVDDAERAADALLARGAGTVIVTLGARGALLRSAGMTTLIPPFEAGAVVETTGAGDAFCGAFAAALAEGRGPVKAARFASAAAGISVTRAGTAPSMARRAEIEALFGGL